MLFDLIVIYLLVGAVLVYLDAEYTGFNVETAKLVATAPYRKVKDLISR